MTLLLHHQYGSVPWTFSKKLLKTFLVEVTVLFVCSLLGNFHLSRGEHMVLGPRTLSCSPLPPVATLTQSALLCRISLGGERKTPTMFLKLNTT